MLGLMPRKGKMTREETKQLLMTISAIYPNFNVKSEEMTPTINAWHLMLEEYPAQTISAALQIYVKTNNTGFAPSVSQLIGMLNKVKDNEHLSEGEAWSLVKKAIQDGNYHSEERFNELPPIVQKAVGNSNMIRQWAMSETDEVNTVIASNFQRTYRILLSRQEFEERIPQQLADVVRGVTDKVSGMIEGGKEDG